MPTYQYRCRDCGEDLEVVQSFTDDALTECPNCKGTLRKVFAAPGISFKGSGFYKTDSRGSSAKSEAKAEAKSDGKDASSKSETKTESKSDGKDAKKDSSPKKAEAKSA